ncbi:uncharacterized protein LOC128661387 [Bombina bombina]|uniref:uncharacterized protein LOC128661387 n=1 Tax=Bombina bombina TaxID=8345 RepID=UPI00235ABD9E|nr:uncharacterized protein LOC128661387 [Bombina bombina]
MIEQIFFNIVCGHNAEGVSDEQSLPAADELKLEDYKQLSECGDTETLDTPVESVDQPCAAEVSVGAIAEQVNDEESKADQHFSSAEVHSDQQISHIKEDLLFLPSKEIQPEHISLDEQGNNNLLVSPFKEIQPEQHIPPNEQGNNNLFDSPSKEIQPEQHIPLDEQGNYNLLGSPSKEFQPEQHIPLDEQGNYNLLGSPSKEFHPEQHIPLDEQGNYNLLGSPSKEIHPEQHIPLNEQENNDLLGSPSKQIQPDLQIPSTEDGKEDLLNLPSKEIKASQPSLVADESNVCLPSSPCKEIQPDQLTFAAEGITSPCKNNPSEQPVFLTEVNKFDSSTSSPKEFILEEPTLFGDENKVDLSASLFDIQSADPAIVSEHKDDLFSSPPKENQPEQPAAIAEESEAHMFSPSDPIQVEQAVPLSENSHTEDLSLSTGASPLEDKDENLASLQKTPASIKQAYKKCDRKFGRTKTPVVPVSDDFTDLPLSRQTSIPSPVEDAYTSDISTRAKALHKKAHEVMESRREQSKDSWDQEGNQAVMKKKKKKPKQKKIYPPKGTELFGSDTLVNTKTHTEESKSGTDAQFVEQGISKPMAGARKDQLLKNEAADMVANPLTDVNEKLNLSPATVLMVEKGMGQVEVKERDPSRKERLDPIAQNVEGKDQSTSSTVLIEDLTKESIFKGKQFAEFQPVILDEAKVSKTLVESKSEPVDKDFFKCPYLKQKLIESTLSNKTDRQGSNTNEGIIEEPKENVKDPPLEKGTDESLLTVTAMCDNHIKTEKQGVEHQSLNSREQMASLKTETTKSQRQLNKEVDSLESQLKSEHMLVEDPVKIRQTLRDELYPMSVKEFPLDRKLETKAVPLGYKVKSKKGKVKVNYNIAESPKSGMYESIGVMEVTEGSLVGFLKTDKEEMSKDVLLLTSIGDASSIHDVTAKQTFDQEPSVLMLVTDSSKTPYDTTVKCDTLKTECDRGNSSELKSECKLPLTKLEQESTEPEVKESLKNEAKSIFSDQSKTESKIAQTDQKCPSLSEVGNQIDLAKENFFSNYKVKSKKGKAKASGISLPPVESGGTADQRITEDKKKYDKVGSRITFMDKGPGYEIKKKSERASLKRPHSSEETKNVMLATKDKTKDEGKITEDLALSAPKGPFVPSLQKMKLNDHANDKDSKHEQLTEKFKPVLLTSPTVCIKADQALSQDSTLEKPSDDFLSLLNEDILILTSGTPNIAVKDLEVSVTEIHEPVNDTEDKDRLDQKHSTNPVPSIDKEKDTKQVNIASAHVASCQIVAVLDAGKQSTVVQSEPNDYLDQVGLTEVLSPLHSSLNIQAIESPDTPLDTSLADSINILECPSLMPQSDLQHAVDLPDVGSLVQKAKVDPVEKLNFSELTSKVENDLGTLSTRQLQTEEMYLQFDLKHEQCLDAKLNELLKDNVGTEVKLVKISSSNDLETLDLHKATEDTNEKTSVPHIDSLQKKKLQPHQEKFQQKGPTKAEHKINSSEPVKGYMRPTKSRGTTTPLTRAAAPDGEKPKQSDLRLSHQRQDKVKCEAVEPTENAVKSEATTENDITAPPSKELPPSPEKKVKASTPAIKATAAKGKTLSAPSPRKTISSTPTQVKKTASPAPAQTTTPKRPLGTTGRPSNLTPKDSKEAKPKSLDLKSPIKSPDKKTAAPKQTPVSTTRSIVKASPSASKTNTSATALTTGSAPPKPPLTPKRPTSIKGEDKPTEVKKPATKSPTELSRPKSSPADLAKSNGTVPSSSVTAPSRPKTTKPSVPKTTSATTESKKPTTTKPTAPLKKVVSAPQSKTTSTLPSKPAAPKQPRPVSAPAPDLKNVRSKIGSIDNMKHQPGGGKAKVEKKSVPVSTARKPVPPMVTKTATSKPADTKETAQKQANGKVQIVSKKVNYSHIQSKCGSKDNIKHVPGGGNVANAAKPTAVGARPQASSNKPGKANVQIMNKKIDVSKVTSKCGSKAAVKQKNGGGDTKNEEENKAETLQDKEEFCASKEETALSVQKEDSVTPTTGAHENGLGEAALTLGGDQRESQSLNALIPETSI